MSPISKSGATGCDRAQLGWRVEPMREVRLWVPHRTRFTGSDSFSDGGPSVGCEIARGVRRAARGPGAQVLHNHSSDKRSARRRQALSLVSAVAGDPLSYEPPLFPQDPATEAWADRFCASSGFAPLAILNPGAGWGAKCWPAESYGAVAKVLADRGMAVMVNYGPQEEALAESVRQASEETASSGEMFSKPTDRAHPPLQPVCRRRHRADAFGSRVGRAGCGLVRPDSP